MKKISVLIVLCFIANLIFAQTGQPAAVGDNYKKMTIAEANALNGTVQPTINGKPYSQYKAEQDALKLQKQQQPSAVPSTIASVTFSPTNNVDKPVINNFSKQSSANGAIEDDGKTDVLKAAIEKAKSAKDVQETAGKKLPEVNNIEVIPAEIITPANIKLEPQTMNMVLPAKTTEADKVMAKPVVDKPGKEVSSVQSSATPEIKVVQADGDPSATKVAEVKPPVAPSSDSKQQLPAKKD